MKSRDMVRVAHKLKRTQEALQRYDGVGGFGQDPLDDMPEAAALAVKLASLSIQRAAVALELARAILTKEADA